MNRLNILDCTLRDGGYINEFHFGEQAMKNVIEKLSKAAIDIIEHVLYFDLSALHSFFQFLCVKDYPTQRE